MIPFIFIVPLSLFIPVDSKHAHVEIMFRDHQYLHPNQLHQEAFDRGNPMLLPKIQMKDIDHPGSNDVMCGRGGGTNNHLGNIRFRQLVNGHKLRYLAATKSEKPMVSREVVMIWRNLTPPGRFLAQQKTNTNGKTVSWYDVGDKKAREKASQCLRERTPDVMPFVQKLDLQLSLQEKEDKMRPEMRNGIDDRQQPTAASISQELLQQQQAATLKAHMALQAYIPPSIVSSLTGAPVTAAPGVPTHDMMPIKSSFEIRSKPMPKKRSQPRSTTSPRQKMQSKPQLSLKEKLAQEIELLKKQAELLENESHHPNENHMNNSPFNISPIINEENDHITAVKQGDEILKDNDVLAEDLLKELEEGPGSSFLNLHPNHSNVLPLSMEEYRKSVEDFMGSSSSRQSSQSHGSHGDGRPSTGDCSTKVMDNRNKAEDRSELLETMSRSSWMKSFQSIDDASMSTTSLLSPGNSLRLDVADTEPSHLDLQHHDHSFNDSNLTAQVANLAKVKSEPGDERSITSFECQLFDTMMNSSPTNGFPTISTTNSFQMSTHQEHHHQMLPSPVRQKSNSSFGRQSTVATAHNPGQNSNPSRPTLNNLKGTSQVSMMSDITDMSYKRESMRNLMKIGASRTRSLRSDMSIMTDNVSDLSEVMGSMDLK